MLAEVMYGTQKPHKAEEDAGQNTLMNTSLQASEALQAAGASLARSQAVFISFGWKENYFSAPHFV